MTLSHTYVKIPDTISDDILRLGPLCLIHPLTAWQLQAALGPPRLGDLCS